MPYPTERAQTSGTEKRQPACEAVRDAQINTPGRKNLPDKSNRWEVKKHVPRSGSRVDLR